MDFSLTEEQVVLQDSLRFFAKSELLPEYTKWDRSGAFPSELWPRLVHYFI